mmetsp:Transcript_6973/g.15142  ORF Transcript_6973/g.15142 Transcript_6973/m.15142 type:complete len:90 (-) Transcript_6973:6-275(-)
MASSLRTGADYNSATLECILDEQTDGHENNCNDVCAQACIIAISMYLQVGSQTCGNQTELHNESTITHCQQRRSYNCNDAQLVLGPLTL